MDRKDNLINVLGITFEENIVDDDDYESSVDIESIPEILKELEKGDVE